MKSAISKALLAVLICILATGCVSSKKYNILASDFERLEQEAHSLGTQLDLANKKIQDLEGEVASLKDVIYMLENKEAELTEANTRLANLAETSKLELSREAAELQSRIDKQGLTIRDLEERNKELRAELASKTAAISELEASLAELRSQKEKETQRTEKAISELTGTYEALVGEMKKEIDEGNIAVTRLKDKLTLSMVEQVLFDSGRAEVKPEGKKVLDRVASVLMKVSDRQIRVEGHTDNVPIGPRLVDRFPTNWELASQRAINVVRYLQDRAGLDPLLLSAASYGQYRPMDTNETPEGKARNRRIEIVLVPLDFERVQVSKPEPAETEGQ